MTISDYYYIFSHKYCDDGGGDDQIDDIGGNCEDDDVGGARGYFL